MSQEINELQTKTAVNETNINNLAESFKEFKENIGKLAETVDSMNDKVILINQQMNNLTKFGAGALTVCVAVGGFLLKHFLFGAS